MDKREADDDKSQSIWRTVESRQGSRRLAESRLFSFRLLAAIIVILFALLSVPGQLRVDASNAVPTAATTTTPRAVARVATTDAPTTPVSAIASAAVSPSSPAVKAAPVVQPLALSARAAYAVDLTNQTELYASNADEPLPPASLTKLVTAIVVVEHVQPDATVTIQADDTVDPTIYSHVGLEVGDVVTVQELLAGMLLNSGGDAALALSRYVGAQLPGAANEDPRQRFVDEMNRQAASLRMNHTHFLDPDGRDETGHVSTAHDIALAAARLFQYPILETLVGEAKQDIQVQGPHARTITLYNTNELLGTPGVHGVKTGTTDAAGECLVIAIQENGARIITVIMGSSDRYGDESKLLGYLNDHYRWVRLGRGGDLSALNYELTQKGYSLGIVRTELLTAAQAAELSYSLTLNPSPNSAPLKAQGYVVFFIGTQPILRLPVYAGDPFKTSG
ncbi:MAG TPA: D-alanyl-D-alanine carboxypeptidase family protein [Nitrolancea sp.]|nr:D-alanyl-D-alanine carboxypeptidase family protein [Nitrolancea sp.]